MARRHTQNGAQILLFPSSDIREPLDSALFEMQGSRAKILSTKTTLDIWDVVICGSFRRDIEGLRRTHEELLDLGCRVLSPTEVAPSREIEGFVYMRGEESETPERIENKHLEAIQKSSFVWLHAPEGYVGLSAALEVGFAHAQGIPIFTNATLGDQVLRYFVQQVESSAQVVEVINANGITPPAPNLTAFQQYYRRVASQRGYERETAENCLLLMMEEMGELARAIRKRDKLVRHGRSPLSSEAQELADVFLYVIHMANIFNLDLGLAVKNKELVNLQKFLAAGI